MLNRRMPNGMYGGVRGRLNPPYSIVLAIKINHLLCRWSPISFSFKYKNLQCYNKCRFANRTETAKEVSKWIIIVYHILRGNVSII